MENDPSARVNASPSATGRPDPFDAVRYKVTRVDPSGLPPPRARPATEPFCTTFASAATPDATTSIAATQQQTPRATRPRFSAIASPTAALLARQLPAQGLGPDQQQCKEDHGIRPETELRCRPPPKQQQEATDRGAVGASPSQVRSESAAGRGR